MPIPSCLPLAYIDPNTFPGLPPQSWLPIIASAIAAVTGWAGLFTIRARFQGFVRAHKVISALIGAALVLGTVALVGWWFVF